MCEVHKRFEKMKCTFCKTEQKTPCTTEDAASTCHIYWVERQRIIRKKMKEDNSPDFTEGSHKSDN